MPPINDYNVYTNLMTNGIEDKLFFFDFLKKHPEINNFVDFGCADGTLLFYVNKIFPNLNLYGIDESREMIERAKVKIPCNLFQTNIIPNIDKRAVTALNLSSVLHEVFFYSCPNELDNFFNSIIENKIDYIFIRDMFYSESLQFNRKELSQDVMNRIDKNYKAERISFEKYYNTDIRYNKKDLVHFLLKYTYQANWERELAENYFSYNPSMLVKRLEQYKLVYYDTYTLPFKKKQIFNDFGYVLDVPTHFKMILKLNKHNKKGTH